MLRNLIVISLISAWLVGAIWLGLYMATPQPDVVPATSEQIIIEPEPEPIMVQEFVITHYCACEKCCPNTSDGITSTGSQVKPNHTIAVDPTVVSYGSTLVIDGITYTAEDSGAFKGYRLDIYCPTHEEALSRGVITREVRVYGEDKQ